MITFKDDSAFNIKKRSTVAFKIVTIFKDFKSRWFSVSVYFNGTS